MKAVVMVSASAAVIFLALLVCVMVALMVTEIMKLVSKNLTELDKEKVVRAEIKEQLHSIGEEEEW